MSGFDATDLRMRVQSSFSAPEMRKLLEGWGASPNEIEADAGSLPHYVVRIGGKRFGVNELLRRLKAEKPLTEWPDPASDADERWAGPVSLLGPPSVAQPGEPTAAEPLLLGDETVVDPPPAMLDGPASSAPQSAPSSVPLSERAPVSRAAPSAAGPTLFQPAGGPTGSPSRGVDTRVVLVGGAVVLGLVVLAFIGGIVWRARGEATTGRDGTATAAAPAPRTTGAAGHAVTTFEQSLRQVAEVCGLDISGMPSRDVLELAQEACGKDEFERREEARLRALGGSPTYQPYQPAPRPSPVDDEEDDEDDPAPAAPRPRREAPPKLDKPLDPPPRQSGAGCGACARKRGECDRSCGAEPKDASLYEACMNCSGRCIAQESRCRLDCR